MKDNPFSPGTGTDPAYFAGRTYEEKQVQLLLNSTLGEKNKFGLMQRTPKTPIVFVGPRGVGKTVLVNRAIEKAREMNIFPCIVTKKELDDNYKGLITYLTENKFEEIANRLKEFRINLSQIIEVGGTIQTPSRVLRRVLETKSLQEPLLLVFDEAQTYESESFSLLVNSIQDVISAKYPVAVIFAGTPDLEIKLISIGAGFMSRANYLNIDNLNENETKEALSKPFTDENIEFEKHALDVIAKETEKYPYFVQLIGSKTWEFIEQDNNNKVTINDTEEIIAEYHAAKLKYYAQRKNEIKKSDNRDVLKEIIEYIHSKAEPIDSDELEEFLDSKYDGKGFELINELKNLGIVRTENENIVSGIPSFFSYIVKEK